MVAIQIRNVPPGVRDALAARAARQGQSLQAYLLRLVERDARFERNVHLVAELEEWSHRVEATSDDALAALEAARDERTRER